MRIASIALFVLIISCQKGNNNSGSCDGVPALEVTATATVQAGGSINLTASDIRGAEYYHWSGPNGFTSDQQNVTINNVQSSQTGKYTVEVGITGGCVQTATTNEVSVTVPSAPCSPSNNTATLSGVSSISFYSVTGAPSGGSYFITANGNNGDIELEFPGTTKPVAGVYSIQPLGGSWIAGDVRLRAVSQSSNWPASTGKVYVSLTGNKIVATFCNISVTGQTYNFQTTLNGRVTEQ
jgi:hypothetical protein